MILNILQIWWVWIILAVIFFILDLIFARGYLLVTAIAAVIIAIATLLFGKHSWYWYDSSFVVIVIIFVVGLAIYKRWAARHDKLEHHERHHRFIGEKVKLKTPIVNGEGQIKLHDTIWIIKGEDMPSGSTVEITAVDGVILHVKALSADF
ncbi:MAG: NfeD family protein [Pseudomonadota bacterium]